MHFSVQVNFLFPSLSLQFDSIRFKHQTHLVACYSIKQYVTDIKHKNHLNREIGSDLNMCLTRQYIYKSTSEQLTFLGLVPS